MKAYNAGGVAKGPAILFVKAEWCPHCKTAKPEMEAAAQQLKSVIPVYAVDSERDKAVIDKFKNFKGFPTIYFKNAQGKLVEYREGDRKAQKVVDWACAHSGNCGRSTRK